MDEIEDGEDKKTRSFLQNLVFRNKHTQWRKNLVLTQSHTTNILFRYNEILTYNVNFMMIVL